MKLFEDFEKKTVGSLRRRSKILEDHTRMWKKELIKAFYLLSEYPTRSVPAEDLQRIMKSFWKWSEPTLLRVKAASLELIKKYLTFIDFDLGVKM